MSILSDEITTDPEGLGYSAMTDLEVANAMNAIDRPRDRTLMTGSELLANTDSTEYNNLSDARRDQWLSLCGVDSIDPFGSVVQIVVQIWGGTSATISNLQAARIETISRAQELNLPRIREGHVQEARA